MRHRNAARQQTLEEETKNGGTGVQAGREGGRVHYIHQLSDNSNLV